jgi:hypothetical protein
MWWMFLQCRNAASMKVLQSATADPVIQITSDFGGGTPNKKRGGTALRRAVPPRVLVRLKSGRKT